MKIEEAQPRRPMENTLPMINVVFLLLIFFMLAGAFKRPELFPVNLPEAAGLQDLQREPFLLLIDADGGIALQGQALTAEQLPEKAAELKDALADTHMQVKADAELDAQVLLDVIEILAQQGISSVYLMADSLEL